MTDISIYVNFLKGNNIDSTRALELLKGDSKLMPEEKNLIYAYCYPRQLLDMELPRRIQDYRMTHGIPKKGPEEANLGETILILEAGKTEQYGRFIKHLMHAFCDPSKLYQVKNTDKYDCCICGKSLLGFDDWYARSDGGEKDKEKEYLAYGSEESSVVLCINCLRNLVNAYNLVTEFDPGYLDWTKAIPTQSLSWSDLKLQ